MNFSDRPWEPIPAELWAEYARLRSDERSDPFLSPGERAHATDADAPPVKRGGWREQPATDKQLSFMRKHRIAHASTVTRGAASDAISAHKERHPWKSRAPAAYDPGDYEDGPGDRWDRDD